MESSPLEIPKEWKDKIQVAAKYQASLQFHIKHSPDQHTACMITYTQGAMAYAQWLYTCQTNYAALKERADKMETALNAIAGKKMPVPNKADMIEIAANALTPVNPATPTGPCASESGSCIDWYACERNNGCKWPKGEGKDA